MCARPSWQKSCCVYGESHKNVSLSTCQQMCSCRFAGQARHFVTFDAFQPECVCVCANTPHSTLQILHSTLYTPHSTLQTLHSTLYTLTFTLCTLHPTLHTLHTSLHSPHSKFTLYTPHSPLYTLHSTLYTPHFTLHTLHSTLHTLHSTLYTPQSTLHTLHSRFYTPHFTLYTLHSTLLTLHTLHSMSTFDSASPYIRFLYVICIRVRWFLLFTVYLFPSLPIECEQ